MSEPANHLTPHPIDELFEAVDERVGLPERDKALAERGLPDVSSRKLTNRYAQKARRDRERDVRANRSGEQR